MFLWTFLLSKYLFSILQKWNVKKILVSTMKNCYYAKKFFRVVVLIFFFSLRNIHNTKQQLVTLQPQRPILMFSSAIQHSNFKNLWNIIIIIYLKNNIHPSVYYYREELISTEGLRFHYLATFGKVSCWGSL